MSTSERKGSRHYATSGLPAAEAVCFNCPLPDCNWQIGKRGTLCPIQRERLGRDQTNGEKNV